VGVSKGRDIVDIADVTIRRRIAGTVKCHDLLVPIFRQGELVYERPSISQSRSLAQTELNRFHASVKRLLNPQIYPVGLELGLHESKARLMQEARREGAEAE
jgi:nicotinate phosphoribosyltransferase